MIRSQRRAHLRVWMVLAVLLPLSLGLILALSSGQALERAPRLIEPPKTGQGGGG